MTDNPGSGMSGRTEKLETDEPGSCSWSSSLRGCISRSMRETVRDGHSREFVMAKWMFRFCLGAGVSLWAVSLAAQAPPAGAAQPAAVKKAVGRWSPPRTPWGDPDLQGV